MSIAHVVPSINHDIGGPAESVPELLSALSDFEYRLQLFTLDYNMLGEMHLLANVKVSTFPAHFFSRLFRGFHLGLRHALMKAARKEISIVHSHGLWMYPNTIARVAAKKYGLPFIISPRGMLEPWSREKSKGKKRFAWHLYERKNIASADYFHVTSDMEKASLRELGITQPVAVIPNGVNLPDAAKIPERSFIERYSPKIGNKKWILFLSRIDPKKGADRLLEAWKQIAAEYPDHMLIIAGPDLVGMRSQLEKYVHDNRLSSSVLFAGSVRAELKACLLAHAEFLVLPSHSENFGNVVVEALSYRTPVIASSGTPWEILQKTESGWWIDNEVDSLVCTMREALQMPDVARWQRGENGRKLVEEKFTWTQIAASFDSFYNWILTGGEKPSFVDQGE